MNWPSLSVDGPFHECVTLVKHLIVPPRCGLRLFCDNAHQGFDQRQLWAIIEKQTNSWAMNAPYRRLNALATANFVNIGNLPREKDGWESKEVDPTMSVALSLSNSLETVPLLHSLFERTFLYDTTCLNLWTHNGLAGTEALLPLVDNLRGFVKKKRRVDRGERFFYQASVPPFTTFEFALTPRNKILTFF